jgi:hypothetical protein
MQINGLSREPPRKTTRVLVAILIGVLAGALSYRLLLADGRLAADFEWPLRGAQALLHGQNPYDVIKPSGGYPFDAALFYPLPAILVALPFAWMDPYWAGALFMGLSSSILAFAATKSGWSHLPIFLSAPFLVALRTGQWGPFILAMVLLPFPFYSLLVCKPNIGLATFAFAPRWRGLAAILLLVLVSVLILPSWPLQWIRALLEGSAGRHMPPLLMLPGPLILLAALFWRKPEGRLLLIMAIIPQHPYWYDSLPLWLIPATFSESLFLSIASMIGFGVSTLLMPGLGPILPVSWAWPWNITFTYLPALGLLYWHNRLQFRRIDTAK